MGLNIYGRNQTCVHTSCRNARPGKVAEGRSLLGPGWRLVREVGGGRPVLLRLSWQDLGNLEVGRALKVGCLGWM